MPELLIIGAGAQARYVINTVALTRQATILGLLDTFDNPAIWGQSVNGCHVLGGLERLEEFQGSPHLQVIVAVAKLGRKREIVARLEHLEFAFATIIHPTAVLAPNVQVDAGSILNAGVICEDNVRIGRHVIVHAGSVLEHDNVVEDFVNIGPGVKTGGRVRCENGATVFTGASLIPDVVVGRDAVVGAGAVVLHAVAAGSTVAGVPARPLAPRPQP